MQSAFAASSSRRLAPPTEHIHPPLSLDFGQLYPPISSWDKGRSPASRSLPSSQPRLSASGSRQVAARHFSAAGSESLYPSLAPGTSRMTSQSRCMHPECLAAASSDEENRCLKAKPQIQTTQLRIPSPSSNPPSSSLSLQRTPTASSAISSASASASSPRHVKLHCTKCNDHPDGFRSEHELRRHTNRVHVTSRKVWITVDASRDRAFLSSCKACTTGKRYNECYNAASHLRRMHFHPRKRGEGKGEKRGGAGSLRSEDPPMEVLKKDWLREVEESVSEREERDEEERRDSQGGDEAEDEEMSETSPAQ